MAIVWNTPAGSLGIITERVILDIPLNATSTTNDTVSFTLLSGNLPRGLRLTNGRISGSPVEVKRYTTSRFVIRASDGIDLEDRTFSISVDGEDVPSWVTQDGFLNVGPEKAYFVLDNARVDFQLDATDTDLTAGDSLEFYLVPNAGQLPPGLTLSKTGLIFGYTDPIFSIEYNASLSGAYDSGAFDVTPLDYVESKSNGYDSYFYDNVTFDYSESSRTPKRLSRIYSFVVAVTDGANVSTRLFKIYVVTEEFLQADNSLVQVDTNIFTADSSSDRKPLWITESNLGRFRANNYVTIFLDVYDPPTLAGTITYFLLPKNPDNTDSEIPPGMELDSITGEIAGRVPYQARVSKNYQFTMMAVNFPVTLATTTYNLRGSWNASVNYLVDDAVQYLGLVYICKVAHRNILPTETTYWILGVSTAEKTFTVEIVGEIESGIQWLSESDRGTIKPNQPSQLFVEAESLLYGGRVTYEFISGTLPPGLSFLPTGVINGKVKQFADDAGPGLTRFFEHDSSLVDSTGSKLFDTTYDGDTTTFDKKFTFVVKARDNVNFSELTRTFYTTVISDTTKTFANLYVKAFQTKDKRLEWFNFITDATIFTPADIYRYGDTNFGIQTEIKTLLYAGVESVDAVKYVQAMSRNHYRKRLLFGNLKTAKAKDPITQETIYEVIYMEIVDDLEKNGTSISQTVQLPDNIKSKVLISYDAISVDSNIPFASDSDHQRVFPNSIKNMRKQIKGVGDRDREFLPLWMRSIQDVGTYELGYTKALVLCYTLPNRSTEIMAKIKGSGFDFKNVDFVADRYLIDILGGVIEDKYLAFPQRGEKLP